MASLASEIDPGGPGDQPVWPYGYPPMGSWQHYGYPPMGSWNPYAYDPATWYMPSMPMPRAPYQSANLPSKQWHPPVEDADGKLHPRVSLNQKQRRKKRSSQNKKSPENDVIDDVAPAKTLDLASIDDETQNEKSILRKLQQDAENNEEGEKYALEYLLQDEGRVVRLCMQDTDTSYIMQTFIQTMKVDNTRRLLEAMKGHVLKLVKDLHGNFVISQAIHYLTEHLTDFIVAELQENAVELVQQNYACRILVRIIDNAESMESFEGTNHLTGEKNPRGALMDELLSYDKLPDLCKHKYAHHVLQAMLKAENQEHVPAEYRHKIARALAENLMDFCNNRNASFLVENALKTCSEDDKNSLADALTRQPEFVLKLAENHFGCFVLLQVLKLGGPYAEMALHYIEMNSLKLQNSKTGRGLLQKLAENEADDIRPEPESEDNLQT